MKRFLNVFIALIYAVVLFSCEPVDLVGTTSIALDEADLTITVGWSSSDDAVLIVDETGLCTAISEGTVVVTVATTDGSLTDSVEIRVKDPFMKVGVPYVSKWGLECTVNEMVVNSDGMTMTCYVNYIQKNVTTDREITECVFQCNKASGEAEGQYGFFGSLFPNETMTRSYTFKTLANDPFVSLEFRTIFGDVVYPDADDLIWNLTGLY